MKEVDEIKALLKKYQLTFATEKELQVKFGHILTAHGFEHEREKRLGLAGIVDFFLPSSGVAIEIKVAGSLNTFLRQMHGYAEREEVKAIVLLCPMPYAVPETLHGKPAFCLGIYGSML